MEAYKFILYIIWKFFPAYVANASPVLLIKKGKPIDFNKKFIDGKPIFGSHKTVEGFLTGTVVGTIFGYLQDMNNPLRGVSLSLGAMIGDLLGSFIKRRMGIESGKSAPILDQVAFIIGAVTFSSFFSHYSLMEAVTIILVTIPIHIATNLIAYLLKIKDVPW
ncbi:MAG: CDP-2,3-bis-(O-geranylgeranyl)-sn-glycerol synthase [archaeon GB-1867-097]|nr:CDP-2,3-bis-(O-geranylgeranyl)-sn-glycerol synthase [Candidatus Verstraetearchaeota archaeon]MCS7373403.1 CDP-2,3-bis-(O-geranylgeranyl)-sn-glycerol synthase [Candidatus Culexmicrobium thermophilum]MCS7384345.1 CDP-2,3-bis-(O-geranylgeranyl)-sn-glycerol synthase [Candidatus Culexmicrobium thermophilum]RLE53571.1 MAG: CDP-2,3-bis-(O-geranylgeranyl)-sn-glycerol synthase [Candidatus Verstraetearchaeota archaeon]HDO20294.1 CDP-2,3-bis-(O-geranylgeranyl)-sn-glycerol synthase [Candidatus Bathyarch